MKPFCFFAALTVLLSGCASNGPEAAGRNVDPVAQPYAAQTSQSDDLKKNDTTKIWPSPFPADAKKNPAATYPPDP